MCNARFVLTAPYLKIWQCIQYCKYCYSLYIIAPTNALVLPVVAERGATCLQFYPLQLTDETSDGNCHRVEPQSRSAKGDEENPRARVRNFSARNKTDESG